MGNKERFLHTMGEELEQLLKQVEIEYKEKLRQLLKQNEEITTSLNKAHEEIRHITNKNEELLKELSSLRQPIEETEVVATVSQKENTLSTHIFNQIYWNLEQNTLERSVILEEFHILLNWNLKSKYFKADKIIKLWIHLLHHYQFMYSEWQEVFKDRNIHALLFRRSDSGLRKLIHLYIRLNDMDALKNLFDYLYNHIIRKGRFQSVHSYMILNILYYDLTKRYFYQKDVKEYYLTTKNEKEKRIYETYLKYLQTLSSQTFLEALGAIEKYDTQIIQIAGSKQVYLNVVFKKVRELERKVEEQKRNIKLINSEENVDAYMDNSQFEMKDKSALIAYGYQISDRTPDQRWHALQKAVPELGLKKVVYIIDNHIKLRAHNKTKFSYSLRQWSMDLEKLKKAYFRNDFIWPKKRY